MTGAMGHGLLGRKAVRVVVKALLVLLAAIVGAAFFGICVPFFLLSMQVLPPLGVAGVVYVGAGGVVGMLLAGTAATVSLARSPRLVTHFYAGLVAGLVALTLAYYVAYLNVDALQRHL